MIVKAWIQEAFYLYAKKYDLWIFSKLTRQLNRKKYLVATSALQKVKTIEDLKCFLENHVSQYGISCHYWRLYSLNWPVPLRLGSPKPWNRYLINEIVVAEESDLSIDGRRQSHYEMYIEAMHCGANTAEIDFLAEIFH
jgi:hypothetical protein